MEMHIKILGSQVKAIMFTYNYQRFLEIVV